MVYPIIRKPTHEWKFNRWVRVRYEEVREYVAVGSKISEIKLPTNKYTMLACLANKTGIPAIYKLERFADDSFLESAFYEDMESALIASRIAQVSYDKACQDASNYR